MNYCILVITTLLYNYLGTAEALQSDRLNAIIMESLKNNLVHACDGERVSLHCPRNTHIYLVNSFYGRLVPSFELCPVPTPIIQNTSVEDSVDEDTSCHIASAYSKIQKHCRNRRNCRFVVKSSFFDEDTCPGTSKYLQISYKCKPTMFDDQSFCEGSAMQVSCKENRRLAIHSAQYGRTINGQALHCTPFTPVDNDCVVDVMDRILPRCHAKSACTLSVNDQYFTNPCSTGIQKYLTLIYMCVNEEIYTEAALNGNLEIVSKLIKEPSIDSNEEIANDDSGNFINHTGSGALWNDDYEFQPPKQLNEDSYINQAKPSESVGVTKLDDPISDTNSNPAIIYSMKTVTEYIKANKERVILYGALGMSTGLVLLLSACVIVQCRSKHKLAKKQATAPSTTTEYDSLLCDKTQTSPSFSICVNPENHTWFDMGDLTHNGKSFMRFAQLTPPRVPQNLHCYS